MGWMGWDRKGRDGMDGMGGMGRDGMDGRDGIGREGLKIKKSQSSKVLKPHNGNTWFGLFKGGFTLGISELQKNSKN